MAGVPIEAALHWRTRIHQFIEVKEDAVKAKEEVKDEEVKEEPQEEVKKEVLRVIPRKLPTKSKLK